MTTFLSGGTGTPKLLAGAESVFDPAETTVVANTGDDVELGGLLVCPDVDTVLFEQGDMLDLETWWGIADDSTETHDELHDIAEAAGLAKGPRYLPDEAQTAGRDIGNWRRFSGVAEFMEIGDRDRAVHLTRTGLLDEGRSLTEVTRLLADAFDVPVDVVPMSDDPVASIVHTPEDSDEYEDEMHFQEFWVAHRADPEVDHVEFRGADDADPAPAALGAIEEGPVVVGPSNPVTSIGPMLAVEELHDALDRATVVAVSPFVEDEVFSGPAADLMAGVGFDPSTAGVAEAYPFADAFVLDEADDTDLDRPVVRTDTEMNDDADAERVARAVADALEVV
ncbi:2-phospho-L-lactate transferase [Halorussus gelatinilyticus]|uniref:2-phospho-L-lactate transferase n=1 Tax=Halorussus gelatinilyticus TaxID=2937524 RepID=A0A8U0IHV3_9EURY|nr:2-phospho-L-lactate transferase [Halorussus gelatinilyticus]UPW00583.1 2-phospho-L-lactate transferase [Halorussus gelatinilyticus]